MLRVSLYGVLALVVATLAVLLLPYFWLLIGFDLDRSLRLSMWFGGFFSGVFAGRVFRP